MTVGPPSCGLVARSTTPSPTRNPHPIWQRDLLVVPVRIIFQCYRFGGDFRDDRVGSAAAQPQARGKEDRIAQRERAGQKLHGSATQPCDVIHGGLDGFVVAADEIALLRTNRDGELFVPPRRVDFIAVGGARDWLPPADRRRAVAGWQRANRRRRLPRRHREMSAGSAPSAACQPTLPYSLSGLSPAFHHFSQKAALSVRRRRMPFQGGSTIHRPPSRPQFPTVSMTLCPPCRRRIAPCWGT